MTSPFAVHKQRAMIRVVVGAVIVVLGVQAQGQIASFFFVLGGVYLCATALTRLIRIKAVESQPEWYQAYAEFSRATLPRQLFALLLAVAEVDGQAGEQERALVRRFLLERFRDPQTVADLSNWQASSGVSTQINALATSLRKILNPGERETVFFWCCQITFADRKFETEEHRALQEVARGLGIPSQHARLVFHHAKARFLNAGEREGTRPGRAGPDHGPTLDPTRAGALAALGLEPDASTQEIRKRHRQLVKRFHPDAHTHLGPVAAEEAEKRFREIQSAYEALLGGTKVS